LLQEMDRAFQMRNHLDRPMDSVTATGKKDIYLAAETVELEPPAQAGL